MHVAYILNQGIDEKVDESRDVFVNRRCYTFQVRREIACSYMTPGAQVFPTTCPDASQHIALVLYWYLQYHINPWWSPLVTHGHAPFAARVPGALP